MDLSNAHQTQASQEERWIFIDFLDEIDHLEHNFSDNIFFLTIYLFFEPFTFGVSLIIC